MPVTAKLSQKFYEKFGQDVTNELVDWFNAVDATYRADLRELNELNFARFDAKLEQRLAELDANWGGRWTQLDAKLEQRLAELDAKLHKEIAGLGAALRTEFAQGLAGVETRLVRWMFTFWVPTALGIVATAAGVVGLLLRR